MKKDLQSYKKHNLQYEEEVDSYNNNLQILKKYKDEKMFKKLGFEYAIRMSNPLPETHIDVGSGNGWLANTTYPLFKKVIGIEPSEAIVAVARQINKDHSNISFINTDMIDGLTQLNIKEPIFLTTGTVLNHIENYYVQNFLSVVNTLPTNSTLYFEERYDTNIDWTMWHVRSKDWWIEKLPNWQLFFLNIDNCGYASGIFGICVGSHNALPSHKMSTGRVILWKMSIYKNIVKRVINKVRRILGV